MEVLMKINKELMKGSTSILILTLLKEKDMYGYEIIQEMKTKSDNMFSMKEGSLYPMLHSLEKNNAVESYWYDTDEGRRRKYYRITDSGILLLQTKRKEWNTFSSIMNNIINGVKEDECYE